MWQNYIFNVKLLSLRGLGVNLLNYPYINIIAMHHTNRIFVLRVNDARRFANNKKRLIVAQPGERHVTAIMAPTSDSAKRVTIYWRQHCDIIILTCNWGYELVRHAIFESDFSVHRLNRISLMRQFKLTVTHANTHRYWCRWCEWLSNKSLYRHINSLNAELF